MSDSRQVKVDNWGIYFLQRLKHFFNRTDYCDLTLQFQDNAQLKVHRLVLSACTEYFELLERTCEMYEDCLVMPDDLQADVVVPIINFMYTGQLEFKLDLLEKLYQTSLIMNMPVLTKLLDAHRPQQKQPPAKPPFSTTSNYYGKRYTKVSKPIAASSTGNKRSYASAFENVESQLEIQKSKTELFSKAECIVKNGKTPLYQFPIFSEKNKRLAKEPRPTRYELPEELDEDNIFDNSFTNISYTTKPLMVHPETLKQYGPKRINLFEEGTSSSRFMRSSANDIVECRKISVNEGIFIDALSDNMQDECNFQSSPHVKDEVKDTSQLFDQILENNTSKITIETKNNTQTHNIDHAKIISEVLKKYPHLVKSNKNIKLKILNTAKSKKSQASNSSNEEKVKTKTECPDFTYESDVINSKEAARLIALGAENVAGPWICLICGTPGKALHFTSYFNFRKHLVEVHNEKPVPTICEYCGVKSQKRNNLVHHKLTKHGVPAPSPYTFPKCNQCSYIALNEAILVRHKTTHSDKSYKSNMQSNQMSAAVQKAGQKYVASGMTVERKNNLQCVYCLRVFLREHNLYAHMKTNHKEAAKNDGIIDDSDEEQEQKFSSNLKSNNNESSNLIKVEVPLAYENSFEDVNEQYQIEQKPDGSIYVLTKKPRVMLPSNRNKILNLGFNSLQNVSSVTHTEKTDSTPNAALKRNECMQNTYVSQARPLSSGETILIDNIEYFLQDNQLVPKKDKGISGAYVVSHTSTDSDIQSIMATTSVDHHNIHNINTEHKMLIKKSTNLNQPLQFVVSNEEEYKALLNANQSVIYDEADSNKALPELGGADNPSLDAGTIDLDNTQSNEMMIIPDDFPINVSETVCADNSNIVVVYSHPVQDQNKQYSLITTQGIESEFVQSSAILTQNYETVTTCTPVVTTTVEDSWQNSVHATINKLTTTSTSELQAMTVGESITIAPIENVATNSLSELPAVQLSTSEPVTIELTQNETSRNTFDQPNVITTINQQSDNVSICQQNTIITLTDATALKNMQQQTIAQIQPLSATSLDQTVSINSFNETSTVDSTEVLKMATTVEIPSSCHEIKSSNIVPVVVEEILHEHKNEISHENITGNVIEINEICNPIMNNSNSHINTSCSADRNLENSEPTSRDAIVIEELSEKNKFEDHGNESYVEESIENIAIAVNQSVLNNNENCRTNEGTREVTLTKIAKEQIENLTSEWSEEECEVTLANQTTTSIIRNDIDTESADTEESIENIQKELDKQVSVKSDCDEDSIVDSNNVISSALKPQTDTKVSGTINTESQEKISSLLNDWDDNDSQDDNTPTINENETIVQNSNSTTQNDDSTVNNSDSADNSGINKNDNIKSLVSDWDDEDEDEHKI